VTLVDAPHFGQACPDWGERAATSRALIRLSMDQPTI
jgi:hypothetical protein